MDDISTLTKLSIVSGLFGLVTEVKKLEGSEFPGKTLYNLIIYTQFHCKTLGFSCKLLFNEECKDIKFTLDNLMKQRSLQGKGVNV